jgi:tRNA dimethylallyltransferase
MKNSNLPLPFPCFIITGPTAVGKTAISIRLAKEINGEIINADSVQIYKGFDIGSAKPSRQEMAETPHHLVDMLQPDEPFSVADFLRRATGIARNIRSRGKAVIVSGGTGLYINAFLNGLSPCPERNIPIRKGIEKYREKKGRTALFRLLESIDPEAASRLHKNDTYRVTRALEVYYATGENISSWWKKKPVNIMGYSGPGHGAGAVRIVLMRPRGELCARIDRRVDAMMEQGFVMEVERLLESGCNPELKPLQSLGYRQITAFLNGRISLDEAVMEIKRDTRRYAKRQMTWFRAMPGTRWYHPQQLEQEESIFRFLMRYQSMARKTISV